MLIKRSLSRKLSPRLRRVVIDPALGGPLLVQVKLSTRSDRDQFERDAEGLDVDVRGWSEETGLLSLTLDADRLEELTRIEGVAYVTGGEPMRD